MIITVPKLPDMHSAESSESTDLAFTMVIYQEIHYIFNFVQMASVNNCSALFVR